MTGTPSMRGSSCAGCASTRTRLRDRNAYYSPDEEGAAVRLFPGDRQGRGQHAGDRRLHLPVARHRRARDDACAARRRAPALQRSRRIPTCTAFHEAFADIVALFQHFTYPAVLESQIRRTRGDLDSENLLGQLAQQFGRATGRGAALRDALGDSDETGSVDGRARRIRTRSTRRIGAHARGAILVAAVFRAFLLIYRARTADLFRIATSGHRQAARGRDPSGPDEAAGRRGRPLRRPRAADVHSRDRLLPAGGHHVRRIPPRHHHRRHGLRARRARQFPHGLHRSVPGVGHLSARCVEHGRRRPGLAERRGIDAGTDRGRLDLPPAGRSAGTPEAVRSRCRPQLEPRERPV